MRKRIIAFLLVSIFVFSFTSFALADNTSNQSTYNTLQRGSRGQDVVNLQKRLIELNYLKAGSADGDYGQGTANAVTSFQFTAGLERTGIADEVTQEALFASDAPKMDPNKVYKPVTALSVGQQSFTIFQGDSITPDIKITPTDATDKSLEFKSDSDCVSIDNGTITAEKQGKAKITVTAKDGSGRETYFYVVCEPACPVTLQSLGTGIYSGNLLALTFKNECSNTNIKDVYFDVTLKAYNGDTISSGSYHTDTIWLGAGSTTVLKRQLHNVAIASKYVVRITGVVLQDGTEYVIPYFDQDVTSWGS